FLDGEQRKDLAALRHVGNAPSCPLYRSQMRDVVAFEQDVSGADRVLPDQRAQQTGLADAVTAEHAGDLADLGLERDAAQRLRGTIVKVDCIDFEHGLVPRFRSS